MDVLCTKDVLKDAYADSVVNDSPSMGITNIPVLKDWKLKNMNQTMWKAVMSTPSSKSHLDSPDISIGPEFAFQLRVSTWSERDPDITACIRITRIPRGFANSSVDFNLTVYAGHVDFEYPMTIQKSVYIQDESSKARDLDFKWIPGNTYIPSTAKLTYADDGLILFIRGSIVISTRNGYTMRSHLSSPDNRTTTMHLTETIGKLPDATIVLRDDEASEFSEPSVLHVHSCLLKANSPCFAAQFTSFKESTDRHACRIDMKTYEPSAVRALIRFLYLQDLKHDQSALAPILTASFSSSSKLSEKQWHQLADTFSLADQHFQYGLMETCMQHLTAYIPTPYLRHAKRLCRYDMQFGDSPVDRICAEFKQRLLEHVSKHAERFLDAFC